MNKQTFSNIARGTMTGLSLVVSVINIADFTCGMVRKYRKPKMVAGLNPAAEDSSTGSSI